MSTSVRLIAQGCAAAIFAQGLMLLVASAASNDAQIAASNRKAIQALAMAERALRGAQRVPTARESAPASSASSRERLRPIVDGHHVQPRHDDVCDPLPASDCRRGNADGVDSDLLREILRRAAP
jgi:hypothetical protein